MIELIGLESAEIMRFIFRGDKYLHRLRDMMLAEEHFRSTTHWERINASVIESWRGDALTRDITDELMAFGKAYSHRRKLEKAEILSLRREFKNLEKYLRDRRKIAKMYDELLEEGSFSRIDVPANSAPSYLRYPILIFDKSRLSKCIKELACAGFHVDGRYKPLHASPSFGWINKNLRLRESVYVSEHILPLPIARAHPMGSKEVEKVASIVNLSRVHGEGW